MQLVVAQMVHQGRLVYYLPVAVLPFDKTVVLCGAPQCLLAAFLDVMANLVGIDVGYRGGEIDARTPGIERRQLRQLSQALAITLGCRARKAPAITARHFRHSSRDCE